jgi:integrase/recombinase XerD
MENLNKNWAEHLDAFRFYLKLEKSLSENSIDAYLNDVKKLAAYFDNDPKYLELKDLELFVQDLANALMSPRSQARIISGI